MVNGNWESFDHLEESITLEELIELHKESIEQRNELIRTIARAMGAEVNEPNIDQAPEDEGGAFNRVIENVTGKSQEQREMPGLGFETI